MTILSSSSNLLRNVLWADAACGAASGLLHLLAAGVLGSLLGLPHGVLVISGAGLLVYVAAATWLAAFEPGSRSGVSMLIAANWAWVGGCAVVFLIYAGAATPLGQAYIVVHALVVAALAELEWLALRRTPRVGWA